MQRLERDLVQPPTLEVSMQLVPLVGVGLAWLGGTVLIHVCMAVQHVEWGLALPPCLEQSMQLVPLVGACVLAWVSVG